LEQVQKLGNGRRGCHYNGADLGLERGEIGAGLLRAFDAEGSPNASLWLELALICFASARKR